MALLAVSATAQSADMFVTKTAPATAAVGTNVTYSITVGNGGPDDAAAAMFTDNLPGGGTFVSYQQNSGPMFDCSLPNVGDAGGTVICSAPTLTAGTTATFSIVQNVSAGAAGTTLINNISVSSQVPDENSENDTSVSGTDVPGGDLADVSILKSGPGSASPDTDVAYTITVTNSGPNDAQSVSFTDTLPSGAPPSPMTFVSFSQNSGPAFNCGVPAATTTCSIATLPVNTTATFTLVGHIPSGTPSGTTYSNKATLTSNNDPNSENDISTTALFVITADARVTKTGPAAAVAGGPTYDYIITMSNGGPDPANDMFFSDNLPSGLTFVSLVQNTGPAANCTTPPVNSGGNVSCSIAQLGNGNSAQFTVTVQPLATIPNSTVLSNTVTTSTSSTDPDQSNNSATAMTAVSAQADLSVVKSGPASANAGTNITYTITAMNGGPSTATTVSLTDTIPANTTFVSESQTNGPAFSCTPPPVGGTGTITCSIASLSTGASATFSISVHISPGATGSISNTVNVSSATSDTNAGNNSSTVSTTVTTSADISVVKTAAAAATAGTNLTYHIVVTNNGPSDSTAVTMNDTLLANTTFVSETQTAGPSFSCINPAVGGTGMVSCSIAALTSGTMANFDIVVLIAPATLSGPSSNTATVTSANDPNAGNNTSTAVTQIAAAIADLSITKTAAPGPYGTGQALTYTIVVTNSGPAAAAGVTVTDVLPAGTTFQSSTPAGACSGTTTITCNAGTLANGASATFTLTITLPSTPGPVTNTATVSASPANPDPNPGNNSASSTITVIPAADIPMVSPLALLLLSIVLAAAGAFIQKQ